VFGRLRAATDPILIVDLLAILPFYLALAGFGLDLRFLRAMRLIRLLRLLKLVRYSQSMRAFGEAFRRKKHQFAVTMTANFILLIIAASLMFFAESEAQPEAFGSIPETMWWAVVTLTTVGYGDVAPVTPLGRVLGGIVAVLGIVLVAGLIYYLRQIRELERRREEMGLDVDTEDDEFDDGPPPGMG